MRLFTQKHIFLIIATRSSTFTLPKIGKNDLSPIYVCCINYIIKFSRLFQPPASRQFLPPSNCFSLLLSSILFRRLFFHCWVVRRITCGLYKTRYSLLSMCGVWGCGCLCLCLCMIISCNEPPSPPPPPLHSHVIQQHCYKIIVKKIVDIGLCDRLKISSYCTKASNSYQTR